MLWGRSTGQIAIARSSAMPAASSVADWLERYAQPAAVELYDKATGEAG